MHPRYHSWGRYPQFDQSAVRLRWRSLPLPIPADAQVSYLPFGNGRSYGDSCLNAGGLLLDARGLDRFIAFDPLEGILRCESGVLLAEILALTVPRGWFPPVVTAKTITAQAPSDVMSVAWSCCAPTASGWCVHRLKMRNGSRPRSEGWG
jgi:hypothetical protein